VWKFARKILLHDRIKFAVATAGVAISVLLVLAQIGVYFGFMQTTSALVDHSDADVWVIPEASENFDIAPTIDERVVYRVAEEPGVARFERVVLAFGQVTGESGETEGVQVVGLEPGGTMLRPWNVVRGDGAAIDRGDAVLVDETEEPKLHVKDIGVEREVSGARARVVALSHGIRSFSTSPYVWTNLDNARIYSHLERTQQQYVMVKAAPGVDPAELAARLGRLPHVDAHTKAELSKNVRAYWSERTGVGAALFTTAAIGVIVGIVVVGQILYSGTLEHLKEYGTLKAMGAANGEVVRIILYQALFSALTGFVPGGIAALGLRHVMQSENLQISLSPQLFFVTALLTVAMCCGASLLSITKVLRLDPASVFKG
jgi:putative ABC transport system permease protein